MWASMTFSNEWSRTPKLLAKDSYTLDPCSMCLLTLLLGFAITTQVFKWQTSSSIASRPLLTENLQSRSPRSSSLLYGFKDLVTLVPSCPLSLSIVGSGGLFVLSASMDLVTLLLSCPLPLSTIGSGGLFVPLASTANGAARPGIEVLHLTLGTSFGLANKGMCLFLGTGPVTREYTPMKWERENYGMRDGTTNAMTNVAKG